MAKESNTYSEWPYKEVLEQRIANVIKNEKDFNKPFNEQQLNSQNAIIFTSKFACIGYHQMSDKEFDDLGYREPDKSYYFFNYKKRAINYILERNLPFWQFYN